MISIQLAVVGGGPGGYGAAFLAADLGLSVTLIDPEINPGGVCVYRGCIPSKALLHVANVMADARRASEWGVRFGEPSIDLNALRGFKDRVVARLTAGTGQLVKYRKIQYLQGVAEIIDAHHVDVQLKSGGSERVRFDHAILATGSYAARPGSLSLDSPRLWDSTRALDLPEIPKTMLVVGGGYIGLELGSVYAALGTDVTIVEMTDGLLPGADRDLVEPLARQIGRETKAVLLKTKVVGLKETSAGGLSVLLEGAGVNPRSRNLALSWSLWAASRTPTSPDSIAPRCA